MNKTYCVNVISPETLDTVAVGSFSYPKASASLLAALEYVEYLITHGFHASVSCGDEVLDYYHCVKNIQETTCALV
jgi:hypothetical protein